MKSHGPTSVLSSSALAEEHVFYILSLPYDLQKQEIVSTPPNPLDDETERNHHELYFPAFDQNLHLVSNQFIYNLLTNSLLFTN